MIWRSLGGQSRVAEKRSPRGDPVPCARKIYPTLAGEDMMPSHERITVTWVAIRCYRARIGSATYLSDLQLTKQRRRRQQQRHQYIAVLRAIDLERAGIIRVSTGASAMLMVRRRRAMVASKRLTHENPRTTSGVGRGGMRWTMQP